jgi:hypothetical protein
MEMLATMVSYYLQSKILKSHILTAAKMAMLVFRVVTARRLAGRYRRFGTFSLHGKDRDNMFIRNDSIYLEVRMILQPTRTTLT